MPERKHTGVEPGMPGLWASGYLAWGAVQMFVAGGGAGGRGGVCLRDRNPPADWLFRFRAFAAGVCRGGDVCGRAGADVWLDASAEGD